MPAADNRMILLDLAAYAFPEHRHHAIEQQRLELLRRFHGIAEIDLNLALVSRLRDLANNIQIGLDGVRIPKADVEYFHAIQAGLKSAISGVGASPRSRQEAMA